MRKSLARTTMRATMCSISCTTIPVTSSPKCIRLTPTAPTPSISPSCICLAISSRLATGISMTPFAPRFMAFSIRSQYDDEMVLKPRRKLNPELIVEEWDNIQRIMVSLALKTTTQDIIVRKLSAFALKNNTRRALWEYDHILRSLYLLDYIDSAPIRRNVQRALNRGENYHQLRRAVS